MSGYMHLEARLFLMAAVFGMALVLLYDLLIVFRRLVPHHPAAVMAEDLFYWMGAGLLAFAGIYQNNQGSLRGFLLLGIFCGGVLCLETVSPLFRGGLTRVSLALKKLIKKVINRLLFPAKSCRIYVCKCVFWISRKIHRQIGHILRGSGIEKNRQNQQKKETGI